MTTPTILTVGHSNHDICTFLELLSAHGVSAIADVRSSPFSRFSPHFNRSLLKRHLAKSAIAYAFAGHELGGRPADPTCYVAGQVKYPLLVRTALFQDGLNRLIKGAETHLIAVMCSERDPVDCHRCLAIGRELNQRNVSVGHILADGSIESHSEAMQRLMVKFGLLQGDLFNEVSDVEGKAVEKQAQLVAFTMTGDEPAQLVDGSQS